MSIPQAESTATRTDWRDEAIVIPIGRLHHGERTPRKEEERRIPARVRGPFAIHRSQEAWIWNPGADETVEPDECWSVTLLPSGYCIARWFTDAAAAERFCDAIEPLADWTRSVSALRRQRGLKAAVRQAREEVNRGR